MSSDAKSPLISVVMSCYNAERWLEESIESILKQTWKDLEFIIVDDGSVDGTLEILHKFSRQDCRIKLLVKANTGLADSLNKAIHLAKGSWVARIDADDISDAHRLEQQVNFVMQNPQVVFVGTGLVLIDENSRRGAIYQYPSNDLLLRRYLTRAMRFPAHSSALFRLDAFKKVGGYRSRIKRAEDRDLWLRLSEIGKLACLPDAFVSIRKHPTQISNDDLGVRQLIDSTVATTSYWIRQFGNPDPVDASNDDFAKFYKWISSKVADNGVAYAADLRMQWRRIKVDQGFRTNARQIFSLISKPVQLGKIIMAKYLGNSFSKKLAVEWIMINRPS